jgi:hypothetical protein
MSQTPPEGDAERVEHDLKVLLDEVRPSRDLGGYLRNLVRPGYHLRKLRDDFRSARHALANRDLDSLRPDLPSLARAFRGRMFATYFLVGPFASLGFIAGIWFQYATDFEPKLLLAYLVTVVVGNVCSTLGFQVIWAAAHRQLYWKGRTALEGWLVLWRDVLPLQWRGFRLWLVANIVLFPILSFLLGLADSFAPRAFAGIPVAGIGGVLELLFVHGTLVRLMGDLFERESLRFAAHHARLKPLEAGGDQGR